MLCCCWQPISSQFIFNQQHHIQVCAAKASGAPFKKKTTGISFWFARLSLLFSLIIVTHNFRIKVEEQLCLMLEHFFFCMNEHESVLLKAVLGERIHYTLKYPSSVCRQLSSFFMWQSTSVMRWMHHAQAAPLPCCLTWTIIVCLRLTDDICSPEIYFYPQRWQPDWHLHNKKDTTSMKSV